MSAQATGIGDIAGTHYASFQTKAHAAATATEDLEGWRAPAAVKVTGLFIVPSVAATGDNTNYTEYNFINRGTAGAGSTEVANVDFTTGVDMVASKPKSVTVTAFNMTAGQVLALQAVNVAAGVALPAATIHIAFKYA